MIRFLKSISRTGAFIMFLPLCAGCAPATKIESNKAADYNKVPHYILVFLPWGPPSLNSTSFAVPHPDESYVPDGFNEVFTKFASNCNIETHTNLEARKDGKQTPADVLISSINPDWIMTIEPTQAQTSQMTVNFAPVGPPRVNGITYNVTITDHVENKKVWRANVQVSLVGTWLRAGDEKQPGRNAATTVIKQMQTDGLLTSCPALPQ
jgi:hypothetical protein